MPRKLENVKTFDLTVKVPRTHCSRIGFQRYFFHILELDRSFHPKQGLVRRFPVKSLVREL